MAQGFRWGLKKTHFSAYQLMTGHCCAIMTIFTPFLQTALIILTPLCVLSGAPAVYATNSDQLHRLLRMQCLITIFTYLNSLNVSLVSGFRPAMREQSLQLYMAPYHVMAVLRTFFLPRWLGGHSPGFIPTGTLQSKIYERDITKRAPLLLRLYHICIECGAWFHTLVGAGICFGLVYRFIQMRASKGFLTTLAWPSLTWLCVLEAMAKPLTYAVAPPDVLERHLLLEAKDGVRMKFTKLNNREMGWGWWKFDTAYLRTAITAYNFVVFWLYIFLKN